MNLKVSVFLIKSLCALVVYGQLHSFGDVQQTFKKQLIKQFGNGTKITVKDLEEFYSRRKFLLNRIETPDSSLSDCLADTAPDSPQDQDLCLLNTCLSPGEVFKLSGVSEGVDDVEVCTLSMILLHTLENNACALDQPTSYHKPAQLDESPSTAETWGYGILCTSIIVLAALVGFLALPFVQGINYKRTIICMVGLAVGTLAGSALLFLIPEALELTEQEMDENNYVWKCLVVITAIYAFFIIERVLKIITGWRQRRKKGEPVKNTNSGVCTIPLQLEKSKVPDFTDLDIPIELPTSPDSVSRDSGIDNLHEAGKKGRKTDLNVHNEVDEQDKAVTDTDNKDQCTGQVAPVAWMIIFGDALHNFIDGISIGAAFTDSVLAGLSVSVAVFCEELPHELGDFAVLLTAGMSKNKAVLYNFLSACTIYVGMVIGIFLGENATAHTWVFAFAGGMFLYIALVDMMPAMCHTGEMEGNKDIGTASIFILQNVGMLTGFGIILLLAVYGGHLDEAISDAS